MPLVSMTARRMSRPEDTQSDAPVQYYVTFLLPSGHHAWWDIYFTEVEEAARWVEWELTRGGRGKAGWRARIDQGHWQGGEFKLDQQDPVKIVARDSGR